MCKVGVKKCKELYRVTLLIVVIQEINFLARGKMAKPSYFLTNCAIVFGWVFHRLCKNLRPFNVLCESLRSIFYAPLLFFSRNQIFHVWNSLSIYIDSLFSQNIRYEDSI